MMFTKQTVVQEALIKNYIECLAIIQTELPCIFNPAYYYIACHEHKFIHEEIKETSILWSIGVSGPLVKFVLPP